MASNILRELQELIGLPACLSLTRTYGGRTVRIPIRDTENHPLTVLLGRDVAARLRAEYGGIHIEIPCERTALLDLRNALICNEVRAGAKISPTAKKYGLSRKMVRKILTRCPVGNSPTVLAVC